MKRSAVLLAALLAACATPAPRAPEPVPAGPAVETAAPKPVAPVPRVARVTPPAEAFPPETTVPVEPSAPATPRFREFVAANDEHLLQVYVGLGRAQLAHTMRHGVGRWPNPYKHEALRDRTGGTYEVFYYLTRDPEGKPVKDRHLTPVIVKDGVIVAIGAYRLKKLRRGERVDLPHRAHQRAS